ncbi:MAG: IPTL-CTERM sorting domain-containing protein [Planctomycetota bacterium]|jgi:hypothetical protein
MRRNSFWVLVVFSCIWSFGNFARAGDCQASLDACAKSDTGCYFECQLAGACGFNPEPVEDCVPVCDTFCAAADGCNPSTIVECANFPDPDAAVPTVSEWGVAVMALLILGAGTLTFRASSIKS